MFNPCKLHNVEVVQFWRGEKKPQQPYPLHWAIYVETGRGIGNTYQIVGNSNNYAINIRHNQPLENRNNWRGSLIVGNVTWVELCEMERILPTVGIMRSDPNWNSHDWVVSALISLSRSGLSGMMIMSEGRLRDLRDNMYWLCLVNNKKPHGWHCTYDNACINFNGA
ncbi:hypothetical protein F4604DRAFT_1783952 [Suillus subluteus]|nr:hypothetical protein F4604DRAFT_1783952 [Suillus subluteus]